MFEVVVFTRPADPSPNPLPGVRGEGIRRRRGYRDARPRHTPVPTPSPDLGRLLPLDLRRHPPPRSWSARARSFRLPVTTIATTSPRANAPSTLTIPAGSRLLFFCGERLARAVVDDDRPRRAGGADPAVAAAAARGAAGGRRACRALRRRGVAAARLGSRPLATTIASPLSVTIRAATSLEFIPPLPRAISPSHELLRSGRVSRRTARACRRHRACHRRRSAARADRRAARRRPVAARMSLSPKVILTSLVGADRVVLVDDRDRAELVGGVDRVADVEEARAVVDVLAREQELRDGHA